MQLQRTFKQLLKEVGLPTIGYFLALFSAALLLVYRLKYLVPGFSPAEKTAILASRSIKVMLSDPLNLPHKVMRYIVAKLAHHGFIAMRGVSVIIALSVIVLFFYSVRRWFGFRIAVITTVLLTVSSWFLSVGRLATPDIISLSLISIVAIASWLPNHKHTNLAVGLGVAMVTWLLYIPGMLWFLLAGLIWRRKKIFALIKDQKPLSIISVIILLMVVAPLVIGVLTDMTLLRTYLLIPADPLQALNNIPKNLALIPVHLFVRGDGNPLQFVGRLPMLDFMTSILILLGIYNTWQNERRLDRLKFLFGGIVVLCLLISLESGFPIAALIPFLYLLAASGVSYLNNQWFKVFPVNPIARGIAVSLAVIAVASVSFYHINYYFVAWPQVPATKQIYSRSPIKP
jgi:hypothetical protein